MRPYTVPLATSATSAARLRAKRPQYHRRIMILLAHILLLGGGLLWVYPFLWMLGSSFKSADGFFNEGLSIIPKEFEWTNYVIAWNEASFGQYFFNTIIITILTVVFTLIFASMAGYIFARRTFLGKKGLIALIAIALFLPHGYTIVPVFDIIQRLGLLDTLWAIIVVQVAGGMVFSTFLFIGYFATMDRELEDAARVDGAGLHQVFWQVMFPLAGPMLATVALFTFIGSWNNFFTPLVFTLGKPELRTLSVGMYAFISQNSTQWTYLCAGSVITLAPIMLMFVFLQRYFVNGVAGAIKA